MEPKNLKQLLYISDPKEISTREIFNIHSSMAVRNPSFSFLFVTPLSFKLLVCIFLMDLVARIMRVEAFQHK